MQLQSSSKEAAVSRGEHQAAMSARTAPWQGAVMALLPTVPVTKCSTSGSGGEGQGDARKYCEGAGGCWRKLESLWMMSTYTPYNPHCSHHSLKAELEAVLQLMKRLTRQGPSSENSLQ